LQVQAPRGPAQNTAMTMQQITLVSPALADANNGNWQTASRWAHMLASRYRVRVLPEWSAGDEDLLLALHARRSAASIEAWSRQRPHRPLVVVLTGTDLYGDVASDASARRSLELADRLVVLNETGIADLPARFRHKAVVCLQSCTQRKTLPKSSQVLRAVMVGHLRAVKDPRTYFNAARHLAAQPSVRLDHIGRSLEPELGQEAEALSLEFLGYRWLGELDHEDVRRRIQRAHVLVHPSLMEGGAHVVIEAIRSGTPVIASRIPGNVGLLGADYAGYFEPGDAKGLARLLLQCRVDAAMLSNLRAQCAVRSPLFDPARERQTLLQLVADLSDNFRNTDDASRQTP
jgi:putative glycosyltransferase (TIGR04348 family)